MENQSSVLSDGNRVYTNHPARTKTISLSVIRTVFDKMCFREITLGIATHSYENGCDIRRIQKALGQANCCRVG